MKAGDFAVFVSFPAVAGYEICALEANFVSGEKSMKFIEKSQVQKFIETSQIYRNQSSTGFLSEMREGILNSHPFLMEGI